MIDTASIEERQAGLERMEKFVRTYGWRAWFERVGLGHSTLAKGHPQLVQPGSELESRLNQDRYARSDEALEWIRINNKPIK